MVLLDVLKPKVQLVEQAMVKGRVKPRVKATAKAEPIRRLENILNHFQNFENALRPPLLLFGNFG